MGDDARSRWQDRWDRAFGDGRVRDADFTTLSGMEVEPAYGTETSEWPGEFPYTRGLHATGYRGRTGVYELLVMDNDLRLEVQKRRGSEELRAMAVAKGMRTLLDDGARAARNGVTTIEEVLRVARA